MKIQGSNNYFNGKYITPPSYLDNIEFIDVLEFDVHFLFVPLLDNNFIIDSRITFNMDSSIMELLDAYDIIRPGSTNEHNLKEYLNTIRNFQVLAKCSNKQLQSFSSCVNRCLNSNSSKDKYYGLCALDLILQQCSSDYLGQSLGSYINSIVNQVFKVSQIEPLTLNHGFYVMAKILDVATTFPDVSRQVSSLSSTLVNCIVELSNRNKDEDFGAFYCLSILMTNYPGACGGNSSNLKLIEESLVNKMSTNEIKVASQVFRKIV